jgi:glycosyltransferase involved in cell wall biosynthesis
MKRLIYILPRLTTRGEDHFEAVPALLKRLHGRCAVTLIAERGDPSILRHFPFPTIVFPPSNPFRKRWRLWRTLRKEGRDGAVTFVRIAQTSAIVAAIYGKLCGGRSLYWHCGEIRYTPWSGWRQFFDWLKSGLPLALALRLSDRVVTGTETMAHFYEQEYGVARDKIRIVPNDFDPISFRLPHPGEREDLRTKLAFPEGEVILFVHRLSPIRRTDFYLPALLRTLERFPTAHLLIIGDGPERESLTTVCRAFPAELQARCRFLGPKAHAEIGEHMRAADIFINPSFVEGFPRVVIEAMGSGLPVLATDAGGTLDLFPQKLQHMVSSRHDPDALAAKLAEALAMSSEVRGQIGHELNQHAQRFQTEVVAEDFLRVIAEPDQLP